MDPGVLDSPVTLVIKAPNQKYEDQTINCFLNWTVEKLKSHISVVYPSRPLSEDQRLVYSGRLLQDHLQLGDVLRKDEYHMMHLICASRSPPGSPSPRSPSGSSAPGSSSSDSASSASANQDSQPASSSPVPRSDDGLRYRGAFPQYGPQSPGAVPQWPDAAQVPLNGGLPANAPPHPMYLPLQMLWWQQMYARQYYLQYQAAVAASQPAGARPPSSPAPSPLPPARPDEAAVQAPLGPNPAPNPLPDNPPANPIQMNAQGGAVLNDDELNRDWLDWLYTVSRAGVLLSIVYFYSSFSRFVMVVGAMLLVYLHQAGWFPFRPEQQNLRAGERAAAAPPAAPQQDAGRHRDMQELERLMDEGVEDDESGEEGGGGQQERAAAMPEPGFLTTAWSFISTFFTSLIPAGDRSRPTRNQTPPPPPPPPRLSTTPTPAIRKQTFSERFDSSSHRLVEPRTRRNAGRSRLPV
ncbi:homocysteine-responsive endoplasmic reticulum-resident ubiquitin-like domain member 2 protein isoform X2 [Salarias fasciatus]|uniref:homocysteine-responsive endoplasmic reticulum-resident ubiquitin-like domain member 2 protein isoform X2 n=1 Tax=Salarias fasciatus TaxID=181472 RepID=UPI0011766F3E|nr:homocysteine-responsive endoplasmic reticulum-resident ubiquitin-like domain member 2 protein isoform X2 [Salarias fasciatus]